MRALSNPVRIESPERGVDGRTTLAGARAPLMTDGRIGDFWIDKVAKKLYGPKTAAGWPDNGLIRGPNGWTALTRVVADGTRRVREIYDWIGGEGTKPALGYEGTTGIVANIAEAQDYRGEPGPQALINALDAATADIADDELVATGKANQDNKKRTAVETFDLGGILPRRSVAHAAASSVRKTIGQISVVAANGRQALYRRASSEPTHALKFRSLDRLTDAGNSDSANGGWWEQIVTEFDKPNDLIAFTGRLPATASIISAGEFRYSVAASAATDHHVTTAGGVKLYVLPQPSGYAFEAWGAAAENAAAVNYPRMQKAIDDVSELPFARRLTMRAGGLWDFGNSDLMIHAGDFHIDAQGSQIVSNGRFHFLGNVNNVEGALDDPTEANLLPRVSFRNGLFGTPGDFDRVSRGPVFEWVADPILENCHRFGRGGTCFNMHFARRPIVRNVSVWGAREVGLGGTIGFLAYHTFNGLFEDVAVGGPGEWVYAMQQKGGADNVWIRPRGHDITYANPTGVIIRDRGDSPYSTSTPAGAYPYSGGAWDAPDLRRASLRTEWRNPVVINAPDNMAGLQLTECKGCRVVGFRGTNARGPIITKNADAPVGYDDGHEFIDTRVENIVFPFYAQSLATEPLRDIKVRGLVIKGVKATALAVQRDVYFENVVGPVVEGLDLTSGDSTSESAIRLVNSPKAVFRSGRISGKYSGGPIVAVTSDAPVFEDMDTSGLLVGKSFIQTVAGAKMRNTVMARFTTTDATLQNLARPRLPADTTAYLEVDVIGKSATGFLAIKLGRWYQTTGTAMAALGSAVDTLSTLKTGTANTVPWQLSLGLVSNEVRVQFSGAAGEAINWEVSYSWRLLG